MALLAQSIVPVASLAVASVGGILDTLQWALALSELLLVVFVRLAHARWLVRNQMPSPEQQRQLSSKIALLLH